MSRKNYREKKRRGNLTARGSAWGLWQERNRVVAILEFVGEGVRRHRGSSGRVVAGRNWKRFRAEAQETAPGKG
jgi:hypothetical protein